MSVSDPLPSRATGVVHMNEKKDSTNNVKDPEEEFIDAITEKLQEIPAREAC